MKLNVFFKQLDTFQRPIPVREIKKLLKTLKVTVDELEEYVRFSDKTYQRNLIHENKNYHALLLCWKSGQRSPIHDHQGSACGFRLLEGTATEIQYDFALDGWVYPYKTKKLNVGDIAVSTDEDVHMIANLQPEPERLITLHIYSPPLLKMKKFSSQGKLLGTFDEPIFGIDGDGI